MSEPILIWGAGAIGGTLGAAFIRAGHAVIFVDSEAEHVEAINADGPEDRRTDLRGHGQGAGVPARRPRRARSIGSSCA